MQIHLIDELLMLQRLRALERIDYQRIREAHEMARPQRGLREAVASALVRLGMSLDHEAGERAVVLARGASR